MPISEAQLETWSNHGKTGQFTDTYNSLRGVLLDKSAPYTVSNVDIYLQGSYGNNTNVWADSDVDVVLCHTGAFYHDISALSQPEKDTFGSTYSRNAAYGYTQFKQDAEKFLGNVFGESVAVKKAVKINGNGNRRSADVLICQEFRRYYSVAGGAPNFHPGLAFFYNGIRIENFPKQHSENCTAKHQATQQNFKRMVRIFKNMRNRLVDDGKLESGVAPSYFIEGMLYNVPSEKFSGSYQDMFIGCFNWIVNADQSKFTSASGFHWLVRDGTPVSWSPTNFNKFTAALKAYWEAS